MGWKNILIKISSKFLRISLHKSVNMMNRDSLGDGGIPNWEPADSPDPNATILYISNMDPRVSADMMMTIMSSGPGLPGKLLNCKMEPSKDGGCTCACFVEFADNQSATVAQNFINGRQMHDKKLKVEWASNSGPGLTPKVLSGSVSVYVGDLDESVTDMELQNHFEKTLDRKLESVKIVKDVTTGVSKGFGFAVFQNKADAQLAIKLHGQIYKNGRKMKINWASRNKPQTNQKTLDYDEVSSAAKDDNCTVYVGGIPSGCQVDDVKRHFDVAGTVIQDARVIVEKGFAFIKYDSHDSATKVIIEKNGTCIPCTQSCLKCWWGKDGPVPGAGESDQGFRQGPGSRDGGNFRRENNFGQQQQHQHQQQHHNNHMQQNNSMMSQQPGEQAAPSREQMKMAMGPMFQMNQITGQVQEQMLDHMVKVPSYFQECMQNWMQYVQQCAMAQQQAMVAQQHQYAMMAQQQQHQQGPPQQGPGQQQQFSGQQQQQQQQGGMMMNNNMPHQQQHHHGQNF